MFVQTQERPKGSSEMRKLRPSRPISQNHNLAAINRDEVKPRNLDKLKNEIDTLFGKLDESGILPKEKAKKTSSNNARHNTSPKKPTVAEYNILDGLDLPELFFKDKPQEEIPNFVSAGNDDADKIQEKSALLREENKKKFEHKSDITADSIIETQVNTNVETLREEVSELGFDSQAKPENSEVASLVQDSIVEASKVEDSKAELSKVDESKIEDSKVVDSIVEDSKIVESKVEDSKVADSKVEDSKIEGSQIIYSEVEHNDVASNVFDSQPENLDLEPFTQNEVKIEPVHSEVEILTDVPYVDYTQVAVEKPVEQKVEVPQETAIDPVASYHNEVTQRNDNLDFVIQPESILNDDVSALVDQMNQPFDLVGTLDASEVKDLGNLNMSQVDNSEVAKLNESMVDEKLKEEAKEAADAILQSVAGLENSMVQETHI